ncbi:MAG: hypothetical protein EBT83_15820, partial [Betaproteobacteria bacterium]|nr:hypothetical protein [Betaproteobacteria bacterium]
RSGARVALVTGALELIGQLSCNPAIGGIAKGTVVREVDALGGIIARATDLASVQFRMLNRGKGPAVWAPRAQCDRGLYRRAVRTLLEAQPNLVTMQGMVARLLFDESAHDGDRRVAGVETAEGRRFGARAVVLTTGTFGRGTMHIGTSTRISGGRAGEAPSVMLGEQLDAVGLEMARFKTGTPPRIDGRSVRYDTLEQQDSEIDAFDYSWSHFWTTPRVTRDQGGMRRDAVIGLAIPIGETQHFNFGRDEVEGRFHLRLALRVARDKYEGHRLLGPGAGKVTCKIRDNQRIETIRRGSERDLIMVTKDAGQFFENF